VAFRSIVESGDIDPRDWATLIRMTRSSNMNGDIDTPQQKYFFGSLASAVARGQSVSAWARQKDISDDAAHAWAERPEFLEMVEKARLAHAERKVREIARRAAKAMDALGAGSEKPADASSSLADVKALIEKWVELSTTLEQGKKLEVLQERVKVLEEGRAVHVRANLGGSMN
jgi:hypothetical protein